MPIVNCRQVTPCPAQPDKRSVADRALTRQAELRLESLTDDLGNGDRLTRALAQAVKTGDCAAMGAVLRQADDQQDMIDYRAEHGRQIWDR